MPPNSPNGKYVAKPGSKKKFDCTEIKQKYPVESYDDQKNKKGGVYKGKQAHHVIQNALFQKPRGTTLTDICPSYTEGGAPCIPLSDGTNVRTEHGRVSKMQKKASKAMRDKKENPTYEDARKDAKDQLMAKPKPGMSDEEAECILKEVDKYYEKIGAKKPGKQLRAPGQRSKWKPTVPKSASGGRVRV